MGRQGRLGAERAPIAGLALPVGRLSDARGRRGVRRGLSRSREQRARSARYAETAAAMVETNPMKAEIAAQSTLTIAISHPDCAHWRRWCAQHSATGRQRDRLRPLRNGVEIEPAISAFAAEADGGLLLTGAAGTISEAIGRRAHRERKNQRYSDAAWQHYCRSARPSRRGCRCHECGDALAVSVTGSRSRKM
jgi:hypothetical protein